MNQELLLSDRIAKRMQMEILSVAEGFFHSSIIFALLKLRIFESIDQENKTLQELAVELDVRPETLARLLNAGVALKLLESKDGVNYKMTPACRAVLAPSAGDHYLGDWIRTMEYFCLPLLKLDKAVMKSGPTIDPSTHFGKDKESTQNFTRSMHNYASIRGKELADFLITDGCRSLLDLGCGPGTYAFHLGMRNAGLELFLVDHPLVLETAKEIQRKYALKNSVHYLPLDVLEDDIPGSYDIILVSNILHGLGERASRALIKRLYNSVNHGGALVIQGQLLRNDRLGGRWPIFLDIIQLCVTEEGRNHTPDETRDWLEEAGFKNIKLSTMTLLNTNSFLRGYKL
jgi:SAM-dependent methyltransferase